MGGGIWSGLLWWTMRDLDLAEFAVQAGVDEEAVRGYVDAGVLKPTESGGFESSDITRARLVRSLVQAGLSVGELSEAFNDGRLSLDYVNLLMPEPVRLVPEPTGAVEGEWLRNESALQPILGIDRVPGEPIREDDLSILGLMAEAVELGASLDRVVQIVRSFAQTASKLADLQRDFVDEVLLAPAIERTGSPILALEETSAPRLRYRELGRALSALLAERFVDEAVFRNLVQLTEVTLSAVGLETPGDQQTIVFLDVSDYTRLAEERGDIESAHQAVLLSEFVRRLAGQHGGRLVKSLGDGAMVHVPDPHRGLRLALEAVASAPTEGIWRLHAGLNSGPMVRRDGDFFGSTVNIAARVANEAGAGQVLATASVASQLENTEFEFVPLGERRLKNVRDPVAIFRVQ